MVQERVHRVCPPLRSIHARLAHETLAREDRDLIEYSCIDLLSELRSNELFHAPVISPSLGGCEFLRHGLRRPLAFEMLLQQSNQTRRARVPCLRSASSLIFNNVAAR